MTITEQQRMQLIETLASLYAVAMDKRPINFDDRKAYYDCIGILDPAAPHHMEERDTRTIPLALGEPELGNEHVVMVPRR